jgi:hypothetical protein
MNYLKQIFRLITVLVITLLIASCNNKTKTNEAISNFNNTWINDIKLNNGTKWEANTETTKGVLAMQDILKTETITNVEDYQQLAKKLNTIKNNIIKECTMKGASHDNLHIWLLPLIKKIDALSNVDSVEYGKELKNTIQENINAYNNYFQ